MARMQLLTGAAQPVHNTTERAREFLKNHSFGPLTPSAHQWLDKRRPKEMLFSASAKRDADGKRQMPKP